MTPRAPRQRGAGKDNIAIEGAPYDKRHSGKLAACGDDLR